MDLCKEEEDKRTRKKNQETKRTRERRTMDQEEGLIERWH